MWIHIIAMYATSYRLISVAPSWLDIHTLLSHLRQFLGIVDVGISFEMRILIIYTLWSLHWLISQSSIVVIPYCISL